MLLMVVLVNLWVEGDVVGGNQFIGVNLVVLVGIIDLVVWMKKIWVQMIQCCDEFVMNIIGFIVLVLSVLLMVVLEGIIGLVIGFDV